MKQENEAKSVQNFREPFGGMEMPGHQLGAPVLLAPDGQVKGIATSIESETWRRSHEGGGRPDSRH